MHNPQLSELDILCDPISFWRQLGLVGWGHNIPLFRAADKSQVRQHDLTATVLGLRW